MAGSPYASSLGRLKADGISFLTKESFAPFLSATSVDEIAKQLALTPYAFELDQARAAYSGLPLIEAAVNRTLVRRNRHAFDATPFAGRLVIAAYLKRWDIENIGAILASKAQSRPLTLSDTELVSSRDIPAGLIAGTLSLDDLRNLVGQPTIDAVITDLVRFGYGGPLLPLLEEFRRTRDIFPFLHALRVQYYAGLLEAARFFQGDEGIVRQLVRSEIDVDNVLVLLKGKDSDLPLEDVQVRWIEGGSIPAHEATDLYAARSVPELVDRLSPHYPTLSEGNAAYSEAHSLAHYDVHLQRERAAAELRRLSSYPMSLGGIFAYLLIAELERSDLRRVTYGVLYGIPSERLGRMLTNPRFA